MADFVLEIVEGPEAGRRIPLGGETVLGRDPAADVAVLQDQLVSRRHVRLTAQDDGVRVEDLGSLNGTFVDGDQIFGPAHLAPRGQLLLGVTVLELQAAQDAAAGKTSVRPIPAGLTALRPLPAEGSAATEERRIPTFAVPEAEPDYVPAAVVAGEGAARAADLLPLLDEHTKSKARGAPIGVFVLCVLAVVLYLALR
jgi:hypothetical protein